MAEMKKSKPYEKELARHYQDKYTPFLQELQSTAKQLTTFI